MERFILAALVLMLWVGLDTFVLRLSKHLQGVKLQRAMEILQRSMDDSWLIQRYRPLQVFRWTILLNHVSQSWVNFGVMFGLGCVMVYALPALRVQHQAAKRVALVRYQFPIYLRQLQVLLQNNTVVKTIELSLDQIPAVLEQDIHKLYLKIKDEPLNMRHYLECMQQYQLPEIQRAMKWLYRYQSIGYHDAYRQFNRMIVSTSKWLRKSRQQQREQASMVVQWLGLLPLFGVTVVFISAMMSVALSLFERG
jgi:hypothetical protein